MQDAGADVLQDGPAEEEEPGSGKARRGAAAWPWRGIWSKLGWEVGENLWKTSGSKLGWELGGNLWKTSGKSGKNYEHLISQSHVETMHEKLDGRKTKTIEHPGTTLKQFGIFRIQPSIS